MKYTLSSVEAKKIIMTPLLVDTKKGEGAVIKKDGKEDKRHK